MIREWNQLWTDVVDNGDPTFTSAVHNMIMASINWIEAHPNADLQWQERDVEALLEALGLPPDIDQSMVMVMGDWREFLRSTNDESEEWFRSMVTACVDSDYEEPSLHMMQKAMACGLLVERDGWDAFDIFMSTPPDDATIN